MERNTSLKQGTKAFQAGRDSGLPKIIFELRNDLSELDRLIDHLEEFCQRFSLPMSTVCQLEVAIEDVFVNTVTYGYNDCSEHQINVTIAYRNESIIVELEDDGIPFNPLCAKVPDIRCPIENRETGGLGIYLTKRLIDDIAYERSSNKNHLRMNNKVGNA
jgi:anti-sigma regulatory factor (Ser/Thr protein kinase)